MLLHRSNREVTVHLFNWITVGTLHVPAALLVDPLSITMCLFVTGISALIHLYSTGYMHGEKDFRKFFLYLNLFVFSMLLLVLANNLLLTFVGWEGVGVCSYWLVSYYFERDCGRLGREEGLPLQPRGRLRSAGGDVPALPLHPHPDLPRDLPPRRHAVADDRDADGARVAARRDRQERADPALQLAARRDGGPDPGVRAHPRRDHGDGRCLPAWCACRRCSRMSPDGRLHDRRHRRR